MVTMMESMRLSPVAYLQQEETAVSKSEYLAGELFPIAGSTANHNWVAVSVCGMLDSLLEIGRCEVFNSDLKVWVEAYELFTYPAAMVVCGPIRYFPERTDAILNPTVIVEVLSKATRALDQGEKFVWYRSLPTLQDYVLIDQYRVHVDAYHKLANGQWLLTEYTSADDVITLESVNVEIPVGQLYRRVDWSLR